MTTLLVGLTGNIASGKSTVARLLSERGATIIDADVLSRRAVEPGSPAYDRIVERWGNDVVAPDGLLDRQPYGTSYSLTTMSSKSSTGSSTRKSTVYATGWSRT